MGSVAQAQEARSYFYRGFSYGSEAMFNPLSVMLNGGFDELQIYGLSNNFRDIPWEQGNEFLLKNLRDPLKQIRGYGWELFLRNEVIPTSLDRRHMQYFPNYTLHLIGGGMTYRKLEEWYRFHEYPAPPLLSVLTTMSYHYLNELIETRNYAGVNVDPIADLFIFDPLGILLFSFDDVSDFFSTTVSLNDWSNQPAFSFAPFGVRNTGQNFVMKYPLSSSGKTSLFYHFGAFGILGLSLKTSDEESISFGAGIASKSVYTYDVNHYFVAQTIHTGPIGGVYLDRNNSLLASIVVTDSFNDLVRVSCFPGLIPWDISPGIFFSFGQESQFTVGITAAFLPVGAGAYHP